MVRTISCLTLVFFVGVSQANADDSDVARRLRTMRAEIDAMISQIEGGKTDDSDAISETKRHPGMWESFEAWNLTLAEVVLIAVQNNSAESTSSRELAHRVGISVQTYERLRSLQRAVASDPAISGDASKRFLAKEQELRRLM